MRVLGSNVTASLRDPDNRWLGLTVCARTIMHDAGKVKSASPQTAAPRLADRAGYR